MGQVRRHEYVAEKVCSTPNYRTGRWQSFCDETQGFNIHSARLLILSPTPSSAESKHKWLSETKQTKTIFITAANLTFHALLQGPYNHPQHTFTLVVKEG